jgi:hypothetical protein
MNKEQLACAVFLTASSIVLAGCNQQPVNQPAQETTPITAPVNTATTISGPVAGTRLTEDYVRRVGGVAYLWGWPMVNMHNRKLILSKLPEPGLMGGIVPVAPMNQLSMVPRLHRSGGAAGRLSQSGCGLRLRVVLARSGASRGAGA